MSDTIKDFMTCVVCHDMYNDTTRSPRILTCGHSVCTSCLNHIKASQNNYCPECRNLIPICSTFPISYTILRMLQSSCFKNDLDELILIPKKKNNDVLQLFLDDLFDRIDEKLKEITSWRKDKEEKINKTVSIEKDIIKVQSHLKEIELPTESTASIQDKYEEMLKENVSLLHNVETKLAALDAYFTTPRPATLSSPIISITNLSELHTKNLYYACFQINGSRKYAKLSFGENFTYLHAFDRDPPQRGVTLINYWDLLKCQPTKFDESTPVLFLDLVSERAKGRVYISLRDSLLSHQMMLLFSGERGSKFKGSRISHKNSHLLIDGYIKENGYKDSCDIVDGIMDNCHPTESVTKGMVLGTRAMNIGGTFTIITKTTLNIESNNIIGTITGGLSLIQNFSYKGGYIGDCGLIFKR